MPDVVNKEAPQHTLWVRFEQGDGTVVERAFMQPLTLGRSAQCDVQFATRIVSSLHVRMALAGGQWTVQDLDSRNGTFLDGEQVRQATVKSRATLQLGEGGPLVELSVGVPLSKQAEVSQRPSTPRGPEATASVRRPTRIYQGNGFVLPLPDGLWLDGTVYILTGPFSDDLQHNITVNVEPKVPFDSVKAYARAQMMALEQGLHGYRILKDDPVTLHNGMPAHRLLYTWTPTPVHPVFQEQICVLHDGTAYRLTATFTRKTRKTLGPDVERIMLGFEPSATQRK